MTQNRLLNLTHITPAAVGDRSKTQEGVIILSVMILVCAAALFVCPPVVAETPSERQAGDGQPDDGLLLQPADETPGEAPLDLTLDHERLGMPVDRTLGDGAVTLYADSAHIIILWDADPYAPHVTAHWSLEEASGDLLLASRGGGSVIRYVADPTIAGYPVIELHLGPNQGISVFGGSLSVAATESKYEVQHNPNDPPVLPPTSHLELEVDHSDLTLTNIPFLNVTGDETDLFASGGTGPWTINLRGGRAELTGHRGSVNLIGNNNEVVFETVDGRVTLDLIESSAFIRGGRAAVEATTNGGSFDCEDTGGTLNISGASTSVNLRRVRATNFTVTGDDLYVTAEEGRGAARLTLNRGELSASNWTSRIDLTVRDGASATIRDLDGDFAFAATDGASIRVHGVTGHVRGTAQRATIEASALKSIELSAGQSDVTVEDTKNLTKFDLTDSTAYLNLNRLRGQRTIILNGSSRADIELHYPCQVRAEGPGASNASRISVDGCEHLLPGQNWAKPRTQRRGEKPEEPIHLTLRLDHRSDARVKGY